PPTLRPPGCTKSHRWAVTRVRVDGAGPTTLGHGAQRPTTGSRAWKTTPRPTPPTTSSSSTRTATPTTAAAPSRPAPDPPSITLRRPLSRLRERGRGGRGDEGAPW